MACADLGVTERTVERWQKTTDQIDKRTTREYQPKHKLTPEERAELLRVVNSPEFRDLPPSQIVPILLDRGLYYASESTIYRILREEKMATHRGRRRPAGHKRPKSYTAVAPNQIWSWDITYLPSNVRGKYHYLYVIMDIFSRKIVGWSIHDDESATHAADLIAKAHRAEGITGNLVLHADNGSPMKGGTMLTKLHNLGITPSFNRPSVSNDNPFSESLFRTLKCRPNFPDPCFLDIGDARYWVRWFVRWYNRKHRHSALKFVTPHQRHTGQDVQIMVKRKAVLSQAKAQHTGRWSRGTRNLDLPDSVDLNPQKKKGENPNANIA